MNLYQSGLPTHRLPRLTFGQSFETRALDGVEMYEYILSATSGKTLMTTLAMLPRMSAQQP
jgi:hypothetical protein